MLGILAIVVALLWVEGKRGSRMSQELPDGAIFRLASLHYGKVHRFVDGSFFQRLLGSVLPDAAARYIGATIHTLTNSSDGLSVFFKCRYIFSPNLTICDDTGTEFFQNNPVYQSAGASGTNFICAFEIPMAARLSRTLRLRLGGWPLPRFDAIEFEVHNPAPRRAPESRGQSPPIFTNFGQRTFSLDGLEAFDRFLIRGAGSEGEHWTAVFYTLPPSWRLADLTVRDRSGDFYHPPAWDDVSTSERDFAGTLSPGDSWDLRFELQPLDGFSSNEIWVSPSFTLPNPFSPEPNAFPLGTVELMGFIVEVKDITEDDLMVNISPNPADFGFRPTFRLGPINLDQDSEAVTLSGSRVAYYCRFTTTNRHPMPFVVTLAKSQFIDVLARPDGFARVPAPQPKANPAHSSGSGP